MARIIQTGAITGASGLSIAEVAPEAAQYSGDELEAVLAAARACAFCVGKLPHAPRPVVRARTTARLLIISQAPGRRVHETGLSFNDRSGDRLRAWLNLDRERFYDDRRIAIVGMGFCYPGTDAKGGDRPPVAVCAPRWHPRILALLPDIRLTLLVGSYAIRRYLAPPRGESATVTLRRWRELPTNTIALPHPSWRNTGWLKVNPWFETELLPVLQQRVAAVLGDADLAVPGPSAGCRVLPTPDTSSFLTVLKKTKRHLRRPYF